MLLLFALTSFFFCCFLLCLVNEKPHRTSVFNTTLVFSIIVLAMIIGFIPPDYKNDAPVYIDVFLKSPVFWGDPMLHPQEIENLAYPEKGFFFLTSLIHTFTNSPAAYYLVITILTFILIYYGLEKFAVYPLVGLCIYVARYLTGRNLAQIRAAIAIAVVMLATKYVTERKLWKFLLMVFIAYQFHHSALIALPLYFIPYLHLRKWHIVAILAVALFVAGTYGRNINEVLLNLELIQDLSGEYIDKESGSVWVYDLGIFNPMIYYQLSILLPFVFADRELRQLTPHYYAFRDGLFLSTLLLILLSQYGVLAGRTSTIFATYDIFMIPLLLHLCRKHGYGFVGGVLLIVYTMFFHNNMEVYLKLYDIL